LNDDELSAVYREWNQGELNGYLAEITGDIFAKSDAKTGRRLIDELLDVARQNGTGMWTSQSAMELQVPTPAIDLAVAMRDMSVLVKERTQAGAIYGRPIQRLNGDRSMLLPEIGRALSTAIITTYAQGFALLAAASVKYQYDFDLAAVARIWRGGCIIRAAILEDVSAAYLAKPDLANLLLDAKMAQKIISQQEDLRQVVCQAAVAGVPVPGLMASLGYLDSFRSAWSPANLIQAQRDYFGAHSYERIDAKGTFHTQWTEAQKS
jgi:6-phosphogluconate dehydrogenase